MLEPMPSRVGIVVRTKDRPDFLARALTDIAAQTFSDWRAVVVNDGGDRGRVDAVVSASPSPERVSVIDTVAPGGRCAAANAGIASLDTPYVVLHDDDDLWHASFLDRTAARLDDSSTEAGVGVATAILYEERRGDRWVETGRVPFWKDLDALRFTDLLDVNRAVPISLLYRRSLHDEVGPYDETLDAVEDWEFYLRVLARNTIGFIGGEPLAFWTQRPGVGGMDGNSMYALEHLHDRDDLAVRDRELKAWAADNGLGLPLYLAAMEKRIRDDVRAEIAAGFSAQREAVRSDIDAHQPVWSRLRRLRARFGASRG